ncbi:MAG: hypothetical protein AAGM67_00660 [Bacteroidota bacterium]
MKIAGVDGGCSTTKVSWFADRKGGAVVSMSTHDNDLESMIQIMKKDGITHIMPTGINVPETLTSQFEVLEPKGDPISWEIKCHTVGVKLLMNDPFPWNCLIVSLGTGTSYTRCLFGKPFKIPIGNALGMGYLKGVGSFVTGDGGQALTSQELDVCAARAEGESLDLKVKDFLPDHPAKDLVVSHFGAATWNDRNHKAERALSHLNVVTTSIAKDIGVYGLFCKHVIFVGGGTQMKTMMSQLKDWVTFLGKEAHVVDSTHTDSIGAALLSS